MVSPDHPTPLRTKTHSHGAVPFAICGRGVTPDSSTSYCEPAASRSQTSFDEGWKLMRFFLGRD
jgi:2,3-bisphosphoglycerate-independent phosphoglycerate mutase